MTTAHGDTGAPELALVPKVTFSVSVLLSFPGVGRLPPLHQQCPQSRPASPTSCPISLGPAHCTPGPAL